MPGTVLSERKVLIMPNKENQKRKPRLHLHKPAPRNKYFTDEEIMKLEDEFLEVYLKNQARPYRTLFRLHMRYWKELLLSMIFYFLKTSPVLALPIVTANIINVVTTKPENAIFQITINIVVMVFLLFLK